MADKSAAARAQITELLRHYRALSEAEKRDYSEEDTKQQFLLPLFAALGWNTGPRGDVRAEEKVGDGYPDYSFRLDGIPVFFLEAKKFSADLGNPRFMKQAINYAYLKGVTWAVLSDFEQLMVFNADWEEKDPIKARFLNLVCEDYEEESVFDRLWLLSKDAMQTRQIDKTAEDYGKKKLKASVTKTLFADLTKWRQGLFREITSTDVLWARDTVKVDEAIQRFLDRLIFIRTVEDRGIEPNHLRALLRQYQSKRGKDKNLFQDLLALFRQMDEHYNARLFAEHALEYLKVYDENLLTDIITGLYDVKGGFATYNFAALDADVLGAVYEQYLSFKAQDPQGKDVVDLSKRTKRKSQGIYYTPKFVVRYIVQQTLGTLLQAPDMTPEKAHQLRILDPACGSGSFLIEAFQVLDRWLAQHGDEVDRKFPRQRQMRILQENLYGVDLDPQAVEVAQLNLLLQAAYSKQKLMLLNHIQHGNSLIDDPAVAGETAFAWAERFPEVMQNGGFDVVIGNPPYVRQETLGTAFKTFAEARYETFEGTADLYVFFTERAATLLRTGGTLGFIMPNKWMRANYGKSLREWLMKRQLQEIIDFGDLPVFEEATTYPCIITLKAAEAVPGHSFRAARVETLDFPSLEGYLQTRRYPVSYAVLEADGWSLADTRIADLLAKLKSIGQPLGQVVNNKIYYGIKTGLNEAFVIDAARRDELIRADPRSAELIKPFLGGRDVKRYASANTGNYLILIPNGWTSAHRGLNNYNASSLGEAAGSSIQQDMQEAWNWFQHERPAIAGHLAPYSARAQRRSDKGEYWWELRPCAYYDAFDRPKILFPDISNQGNFSYDSSGSVCSNTSYFIGTDSLLLLGILNSKLFNLIYPNVFSVYRGGYFRFFTQYVEQLPIRVINPEDPTDRARHDRMVALVETMLRLQREYAAADAVHDDARHGLREQIERTDAEIDALVYELYGLTEDEITLIEGQG